MSEGSVPKSHDRRAIRRYLAAGVELSYEPVPEYLETFQLAEILGVKPWEVESVPEHWREKAKTVYLGRKEARFEIFNRFKGQKIVVISPDV